MGAKGNQHRVNKRLGAHLEDRMTPEQRRRLAAQSILEGKRIGDLVAEIVEKYLKEKGV